MTNFKKKKGATRKIRRHKKEKKHLGKDMLEIGGGGKGGGGSPGIYGSGRK